MTTYFKEYYLTAEQRSLLRDLIVYMISQCDIEINSGKTAPYIAKRSTKLEILYMLNEGQVVKGMDSVIFVLRDVAELCKEIPEELRSDYRRTTLRTEGNVGFTAILAMYPNDTIVGLKTVLLGDSIMSSTNNFW
jgi:hypothetical protein